ncbi:MAG: amidohydrolase family protein [Planctomycetia bacterium]|nr:amidohydrolase family protein [Planctomycetia bacterium]
MLTRRNFLLGAIAVGAVTREQSGFGKGPQPGTLVNFDVPAGACDCHTHIFGEAAKFPFSPGRTYTPEPALPDEMAAFHKRLKMQRVVIVTPSVYGTDNSATVFGIKARGADARGIAVIDDKTSESELDDLARAGFRGIRLNLATAGINDPDAARKQLEAGARRVKKRGWHVQVYTNTPLIAQLKDTVAELGVPVVFDHFGGAQAAEGLDQPGFPELVELVRSGKAYVKVSGAYRASQRAPDYADVVPLAKALISANADRVVWGTDWPHPDAAVQPGRKSTDVSPPLAIDDGRLLNELPVWAPDPAIRKKILVENPARLYGF